MRVPDRAGVQQAAQIALRADECAFYAEDHRGTEGRMNSDVRTIGHNGEVARSALRSALETLAIKAEGRFGPLGLVRHRL